MKNKVQYESFLKCKAVMTAPSGFDISPAAISTQGFPFQRDVVRWELRKGKAAMFEDCGLGKTWQSLEWSRHVFENTNVPILNVAPFSVAMQTQREGEKFGIPVNVVREQAEILPGVNITNYEMLPHFDPREFAGIYIDESSILKGDGPLRKRITEFAAHIPYRLAGTATPAPNDNEQKDGVPVAPHSLCMTVAKHRNGGSRGTPRKLSGSGWHRGRSCCESLLTWGTTMRDSRFPIFFTTSTPCRPNGTPITCSRWRRKLYRSEGTPAAIRLMPGYNSPPIW